jgi:hypothetical protein
MAVNRPSIDYLPFVSLMKINQLTDLPALAQAPNSLIFSMSTNKPGAVFTCSAVHHLLNQQSNHHFFDFEVSNFSECADILNVTFCFAIFVRFD